MIVKEKFKLIGVDCPSCVLAIRRSLSKLEQLIDFRIDSTTNEAIVTYDSEHVSTKDIVEAIRKAGYDVVKREIIFIIKNADNYEIIEEYLKKKTGVIRCYVSHVSGIIRVIINPYSITEKDVEKILSNLGFKAEKISKEHLKRLEVLEEQKSTRVLYRKIISFILGLFLVIYYGINLIGLKHPLWPISDSLGFIISSIVILLNIDLISKGYRALLLLAPVMDSLIALSTTTTYIYSIAVMMGLFPGAQAYFEASAGVLGFVSMGEYIESRLRSKAGEAIKKLMELQRSKVRVVRNGEVSILEPEEVRVGDIVEVKAGERIVVDGIVIDGEGWVDESTFTGEPVPVKKSSKRRDPVLAGTMLKQGFLRIKVTRVGEDTSLAHIIESVKRAQLSKPRIQRLADKIVGAMTWVVICISILTLVYWLTVEPSNPGLAVMFAASVLVITCPCPLGIAIPLVISIAVSKATKLGLLIRDSRVFEKILSIDTVGFDKTGTLTVGEPVVEKIILYDEIELNKFLQLVCSIESRSEHIIGKTIMNFCRKNNVKILDPKSYEHVPGKGVIGIVDGIKIVIGSDKLLNDLGAKIPRELEKQASKYRMSGKTVIYVYIGEKPAGLIVVGDKIRSEAPHVIKYIKNRMKAKTILLTGDNFETASIVAKELGIDDVYAELSPEQKSELIHKLQVEGRRVAYIGDGINDAVALTGSFLGIAMG
ncbi:MAG: heavy metal translocating P-type ATPase, partial [Staphylothermus sp.]|nr:heavy metal translocating P-type ATPase [Staphylothermus sp.]